MLTGTEARSALWVSCRRRENPMVRREERNRLLAQARDWFGDEAQVDYYAGEVALGATLAEQA